MLYLRAVDGVLFDLTTRDETAADAAPPVETRAPGPEPPAQPLHLRAEVVDGVVNLMWQQPPDHALPVSAWEVWRDGVRHAIVSLPMALDDTPVQGEHQYSVVALGDGGERSVRSRTCTVDVTKPEGKPAPPASLVAAVTDVARDAVPAGGGGGPPRDKTSPLSWPEEDQPLVFGRPARRRGRLVLILLVLAGAAAFGLWRVVQPGPVVTSPPTISSDTSTTGVGESPDVGKQPAVSNPPDQYLPQPDLVVSYLRELPNNKTLVFEVVNQGADVGKQVTVEVTVGGGDSTSLSGVTVQPPDGRDQNCPVGAGAISTTCTIDDLTKDAPVKVYATVSTPMEVTVTVTVTVTSQAGDENPGDNCKTHSFSPDPSTPTPAGS
ncbi:hypothetical protein [Terrabacter sp. C0L_2]|uniref:hypothetical protein n=1 Tax=Terrabacter sp. C0L_2 TaxID=3108389 RepID=UPI002ED36F69|nr:hypothetical protein U5C87_01815 [Terrabacter sp. C0L_2]